MKHNNDKPKQNILIGIPCLDGKFDYRFLVSLITSLDSLRSHNIQYKLGLEIGSSLIADARNRIVGNFLEEKELTDLVFIDADIAWNPEDLLRLLSYNLPMVAATYQKKSANLSFAVKFLSSIEARGPLLTASHIGTGFMRLRRDCLNTIIANRTKIGLKSYRLTHEDHEIPKDIYAFFDTGIDTYYQGEDYYFCDLWRATGNEVLLDPHINLQHIGTKAFDEQITNYLQPSLGGEKK